MIRYSIFLFVVVGSIVALGEPLAVQNLSKLKLEFDIDRASLLVPLEELDKSYSEQLTRLLDQVANAGDLEKAVIVKAVIDGIEAGESIPVEKNFNELKRLQEIYVKEHDVRSAAANENLGRLISSHQPRVLALQTQLTKEKKLDEALKAMEEIKRLDELARHITPKTTSADSNATVNSFRVGSPVEALTSKTAGDELAIVLVEGQKWGQLANGEKSFSDADYKWENVPQILQNIRFSLNGKHSHTLKFEVEKPGLVFIATSPRFFENSGTEDSREADALDLKGLKGSGWRHIRQFDGLRNESTGSAPWMIFYRACAAGEVFAIRTEKYLAPVLLHKLDPP